MLHLLISPQHWAEEMMSRKGKRKAICDRRKKELLRYLAAKMKGSDIW